MESTTKTIVVLLLMGETLAKGAFEGLNLLKWLALVRVKILHLDNATEPCISHPSLTWKTTLLNYNYWNGIDIDILVNGMTWYRSALDEPLRILFNNALWRVLGFLHLFTFHRTFDWLLRKKLFRIEIFTIECDMLSWKMWLCGLNLFWETQPSKVAALVRFFHTAF